MRRRIYSVWCIFLLIGNVATANLAIAKTTSPVVDFYTGARTGTYVAIARDLKQVLAEHYNTQLSVHPTSGSVENIKQLDQQSALAFAIVQSDVLGFLRRSEKPSVMEMAEKLRVVAPLYREEVHVLANKAIDNFKALEGKRVVVGKDGSGHLITAVNLMALLRITPERILKLSPAEGILAVLDGKADAAIFVAGKPVKLFQNLETLQSMDNRRYASLLENVHLLPLNYPELQQEYKRGVLEPDDYNFVETPVPTLSVTALMVTQQRAKDKHYCNVVSTIMDALRKTPPESEMRHPKWQEIKTLPKGWKPNVC